MLGVSTLQCEDWQRDSQRCKDFLQPLFDSGEAYRCFRELLPKYVRPGCVKPALGFSVDYIYGPIGYAHLEPGVLGKAVYWDTTFRIRLLHMGRFLAGIGFHPRSDTLTVMQIQALQGKEAELSGIRWERALVAFLLAAVRGEYASLAIMPARHNQYWPLEYKNDPPEKKTFRDRLHLRYDVTARRMGFRYHAEYKLWVYDLRTG